MKKRMVVVIIFVVVIGTAYSYAASFLRPAFSGVYHEASCPSVDVSRMQRMKRDSAEAVGLLPAPDCHPDVRVRYLGIRAERPPVRQARTLNELFRSAAIRVQMEHPLTATRARTRDMWMVTRAETVLTATATTARNQILAIEGRRAPGCRARRDTRAGSYLTKIYPSPAARAKDRDGVAARLIEYRLGGKGKQYRVLCSILDPRKAPAIQLANLYPKRWTIETALGELKTRLRGARAVLRSRIPARCGRISTGSFWPTSGCVL
jgi:hypothetical protein